MGVRVVYSDSTVVGGHRGLFSPDADGLIKFPSKTSNIFLRSGTCGSAPLYHQVRYPRYAFVGSVRVQCYYEEDRGESLGYYQGTWAIIPRINWDDSGEVWHYYSKNGKRYTSRAYPAYKDESKFRQILKDKSRSVSERALACWALCAPPSRVYLDWDNGPWPMYNKADGEAQPMNAAPSRKYLDFWELATETGLVFPEHDLLLALSEASEDLAASLPQTPINIAESLVDLVSVRNISNVFRTTEKVSAMLADSWLKWRYVYTTTKLDVRSMHEFLDRGLSLFESTCKSDFSCHGYAHIGDLTCRCSTTLQSRQLKEQFRRASQSLHTYDLWDLVPWSFVVDWFIPIGSMLQNLEYQSQLLKLDHGTIWYTCEWYEDSDSENFMRFCTDSFVTTPCTIINGKGPTNKTISMRCIDAMALLIGR